MPIAGQFPPLPNFFFVPLTSQGWTSEEKLDWLTTVRGRLGWAQGANLWYMTGGVAWARIESKYTLVSSPGNTGLLVAGGAALGPALLRNGACPAGPRQQISARSRLAGLSAAGLKRPWGSCLDWAAATGGL